MKLGNFFETRKRDSGESFATLKDDVPQWLLDAVRDAHQGDLPDDWIFAECLAACEAIDDDVLSLGDESYLHDHADSRVDIYTKNLFRWAADQCLSSTWSEAEERSGELCGDETDLTKRLQCVQYCAIEYIASIMLEAWRAQQREES